MKYSFADCIVIKFGRKLYPGKVMDVNKEEELITVKCLKKEQYDKEKGSFFWTWPPIEDIVEYFFTKVVGKIDCPIPVTNVRRILFRVKEMESI